MYTYTRQLARFARAIRYDSLSEQAVRVGKMCVEDLIGVALAGSAHPHGKIWHAYFTADGHAGPVCVWEPHFPKMDFREAAALNAAYAHLLDLDDLHNSSIVHLGTVTIPAAIAVGSRLHCSGRQVLAAIAAGYEVGARTGEAITPGSYYYWHTTGVVGALAAAAAVGNLLGLDDEQYLNALGSAGTQAAGLWEFLSDGAMSKALHTANATLCGIRSAYLAQLGLTGASRILEGERGLLRALTPEHHEQALVRDMDQARLKILEISFKPYACCRHTHSADYAMQLVMARRQLEPDSIVRIVDRTYEVAKQTVDCSHPATAYACKFSAQYCIAAILLRGKLTDCAFSPSAVSDPQVLKLMEKITVVADPALEQEHRDDPNRWPHLLEITLDSGECITEKVSYPLGDAHNPFDWDALDNKFLTVTNGVIPLPQAQALCQRIRHLDELDDIALLFPAE